MSVEKRLKTHWEITYCFIKLFESEFELKLWTYLIQWSPQKTLVCEQCNVFFLYFQSKIHLVHDKKCIAVHRKYGHCNTYPLLWKLNTKLSQPLVINWLLFDLIHHFRCSGQITFTVITSFCVLKDRCLHMNYLIR